MTQLATQQASGLSMSGAEVNEIITESPATLELMERAEIDTQVATAKRYPRSATKAFNEALSLATLTPEIAAGCSYALKRGGKTITGPSVRLAEMVATSWGNLRITSRIVREDSRFITAEATCLDVEKNIGARIEVSRRITDREGRKYNDDMVAVTGAAAISIAYRNAIFRVVPRAMADAIEERAKACAAGDLASLADRRSRALGKFTAKGVSEARIFEALGVRGMDDIQLDQLTILQGFWNAIKDGETTLDELFPIAEASPVAIPGESKSESVLRKVKERTTKPRAEPEPTPAAEPTDDDLHALDAAEPGSNG